MKIVYYSPLSEGHGGVTVVLKQVKALRLAGHEVELVEWPNAKVKTVPDIAIATWFMTCGAVQESGAKIKGYLIQHNEGLSYGDVVGHTYAMPWDFAIVVSPWLQKFVEGFGLNRTHLYTPAYDLNVFQVYRNKINNRVLYFSRRYARKDPETGFEALRLIKSKRPDIEIVTFDTEPLAIPYSFIDKHIAKVMTKKELAQLYSSATVYMQSTPYEGFGILSLEAIACGTMVVTPDDRGTEGFGEGVIDYSKCYDPKDIADRVIYWIDHPTERNKREFEGLKRVSKISWDKSGKELAEFIKKIC